MDTIAFSGIPARYTEALEQVFRIVKGGKESGEIDETMVREALGEQIHSYAQGLF